MFFRDMTDKTFDEIYDRQSLFHILFILVPVIVKSNGIAIIPVNPVFQFVEKSCAESIAQIVVVKVFYMAPESIITVAAFGKKAVNVGIPFEIAAKSMKDHDIAGSKIFGMVRIEKHP